jgi:hypothetical protein
MNRKTCWVHVRPGLAIHAKPTDEVRSDGSFGTPRLRRTRIVANVTNVLARPAEGARTDRGTLKQLDLCGSKNGKALTSQGL